MPLTALTEPLGVKRAAHLLRRSCFGGSIQEIESFAALTPAEAVQQLFDTTIPDPVQPIDPLTGQEWTTTGSDNEDSDLIGSFLRWNLAMMLGNGVNENQKLAFIFRERIVYFLHTHFTTKRSTVSDAQALYFQQALFRLFAFDNEDLDYQAIDEGTGQSTPAVAPRNFKQLVKKISVDNAMLIFLDGDTNTEGSVNENYARELLELYSIGRGLEGTNPVPEFEGDYFTFTEQDVQEGARVLSGFEVDESYTNLDEETGIPMGVLRGGNIATAHDNGTKTLSSRFADAVITPDAELMEGGLATLDSTLDEISQLVDVIFEQDETAIHICRELYRFFIYHEVDEAIQSGIIQDMTDIFVANEYKMQPVLEALFTSQEFYEGGTGEEDNSFGCIIKSPLELVVGYMRNFDIAMPDYTTEVADYHELADYLMGSIGSQGMNYYEPFEVAGYSAYHQYPIYNRSWINPNYLADRYSFIQENVPTDTTMLELAQMDILQFVTDNFDLATIRIPRDFIISVAQYFLPANENLSFDTPDVGELTVERLNYFYSVVEAISVEDDFEDSWTRRWDDNIDPDTRRAYLSTLFNAMLQSPEYQLM